MSREIARDLSRDLQTRLADVLGRQANIASAVLPFPEVSFLMIEAAVMMVRTVGGTIANSLADTEEVAAVYEVTVKAIIEQVEQGRADAIEKIAAEINKRRAAA